MHRYLDALIIRQQAKDPVGRAGLPLVLIRHACRIVRERVTRIDFDQVVDDKHLQDPQDIQSRLCRMLRKHHGDQAQVP